MTATLPARSSSVTSWLSPVSACSCEAGQATPDGRMLARRRAFESAMAADQLQVEKNHRHGHQSSQQPRARDAVGGGDAPAA